MLTLPQCLKIGPDLDDLSDGELLLARDQLYDLAQLIFEDWWEETQSSKYPTRDFTVAIDRVSLKYGAK